ncbi:MAG: methyltransferase [Nanoarchaeota archaeon]|nr:methyltransferase [Nanoarchaeota archaeon]
MSLIYEPEDDSYLLETVLKKELPLLIINNKKLKFLEVGIGSGIQLVAAKEAGVDIKNISGVDVNIDAISHCQSLGFNCMKSNLFDNVTEKFDVIAFNPPYLPEDESPEDEESKLITTGGKLGSELPNEFLRQAKSHLKENGRIYLLVSSLTEKMDWQDYKKELIAEKKIFFEKLEVWKLML